MNIKGKTLDSLSALNNNDKFLLHNMFFFLLHGIFKEQPSETFYEFFVESHLVMFDLNHFLSPTYDFICCQKQYLNNVVQLLPNICTVLIKKNSYDEKEKNSPQQHSILFLFAFAKIITGFFCVHRPRVLRMRRLQTYLLWELNHGFSTTHWSFLPSTRCCSFTHQTLIGFFTHTITSLHNFFNATDNHKFLFISQLFIKSWVQLFLLKGFMIQQGTFESFKITTMLLQKIKSHHPQPIQQFIMLLDKLRHHLITFTDIYWIIRSVNCFFLSKNMFLKCPFK